MSALSRKLPLVVGVIGVQVLAIWIAMKRPSPGAISDPHASIAAISENDCAVCHAPGGINSGCLGCHTEIAEQLDSGEGYHAALDSQGHTRCASCHGEHYGHDFALVNTVSWQRQPMENFTHDHVMFDLHAAHDDLACEDCHNSEHANGRWPELITGKPREVSFLGLTQSCESCHGDPHGDGMEGECQECHDQHSFIPAPGFNHDEVFALTGAHASTDCRGCHLLPTKEAVAANLPEAHPPLPFDRVTGEACKDCHQTPHTGLNEAMYGDDCASCHETDWFKDHTFTIACHPASFPLLDAHADLACAECHKLQPPPTLNGLGPNDCASCHQNPHVPGGRAITLENAENCADCHSGGTWELAGAGVLAHERLGFPLIGAHAKVACETCHTDGADLTGKGQNGCETCHASDSPHKPDYESECASCHQLADPGWMTVVERAFAIGQREHARTTFPLVGAHTEVACASCHNQGHPSMPRIAESCENCHTSPHIVEFSQPCADCHVLPDNHWHGATGRMTPVQHAETGFPLVSPHADVTCEECHRTPHEGLDFAARYPGRSEEDCVACHTDPHAGQFAARTGNCRECHRGEHFLPHNFGLTEHAKTAFPLDGPHADVPCEECHKLDAEGVRQFISDFVARCEDCHDDPHDGQFLDRPGGCEACHTGQHFMPTTYGMAEHTTFPLTGAHRAVPCVACHQKDGEGIRRFRELPTNCSGCHDTPHGDQFQAEIAQNDCSGCHRSTSTWRIRDFNHDTTGWPLTGEHARAACARCHGRRAGSPVVQYENTPTDCAGCHTNVHGLQFGPAPDCTSCHRSTTTWTQLVFVHNRDSRFHLDGSHDDLPCDACHKNVKGPDGITRRHYKPLGTECQDCHDAD